MGDDIIIRPRNGREDYSTDPWLHLEHLIMWFGPEMMEISTFPEHVEYSLVKLNLHESIPKKYDKITKNSPNMVVDMYIISPKKDQFKPVFFSLFDFSKMKRPRQRLQKTNKQSFLVLVMFGLSPVWLQSFASPRTGLSNTKCVGDIIPLFQIQLPAHIIPCFGQAASSQLTLLSSNKLLSSFWLNKYWTKELFHSISM